MAITIFALSVFLSLPWLSITFNHTVGESLVLYMQIKIEKSLLGKGRHVDFLHIVYEWHLT